MGVGAAEGTEGQPVQPPDGTAVRVALAGGSDQRVVEAAFELIRRRSVTPVLVADPAVVEATARRVGSDPSAVEAIAPSVEEVREPVRHVASLVREGRAHTCMAGSATSTPDVLTAYHAVLDVDPRCGAIVGSFLMDLPDGRQYLFADCAVHPDPSPALLATIGAIAAGRASDLLGGQSRVAFLSFSTHGSADHPRVTKVRAALRLLQDRTPWVAADGELQGDAALDPSVAVRKVHPLGEVAGRANVLVFPDLDAANIAYKLVRVLAGADALGVLLDGFEVPVVDLSRGATVHEVVRTAEVLARAMLRRRLAGPSGEC